MKVLERILVSLFIFVFAVPSRGQNIGIGTDTPGADLEIRGENNSAALFWDDGKAALRHHFNALTWERSIFNMFLDANNDQEDASFSIFTNSFTDSGVAKLKFDLEDGDSWLSTSRFGINTTSPSATLDVNGSIRVGSEIEPSPTAGTIKFENGEFLGFDGQAWQPFVTKSVWGNQKITSNESYVYFDSGLPGNDSISDFELTDTHCFIGIPDLGEVRILQRNGTQWNPIQTLTYGIEGFGKYLEAENDRLIVSGASGSSSLPDTLVYFSLNGTDWIHQQDIPLDYNIPTLGLDATTQIRLENDKLAVSGLSFLDFFKYENQVWASDSTFTISTGGANSSISLGSIGLTDEYAIVGLYNLTSGESRGILVLENVNSLWQVSDTLLLPIGSIEDSFFGATCAILDDNMIITEQQGLIGAEYVLHYYKLDGSTWEYNTSFSSPDEFSVFFGKDTELYGDQLVVSQGVSSSPPSVSYSFYLFNIDAQPQLSHTFVPSSQFTNVSIDLNSFGQRVAMSNTTIATLNMIDEPRGIYFFNRN